MKPEPAPAATTPVMDGPRTTDQLPDVVVVRGKHKLACPHCGAKGLDNFQWLEEITSYRELISLKRGVLLMHSYYQVFDENGTCPRLLCKTCDQESLVPE